MTFSVFEVESVEKCGDDFVLDVKVLPDRACYALSHRGIARELAAALAWESDSQVKISQVKTAKLASLVIKIENPADCRRYIGRRTENVAVRLLQNEISEKLASVEQRSINNIVDAANFVMFDIGQPLHAFDADKVVGAIQIRRAKKGEKIITLDDKEIILTPDILIIADDESPLAIAGIKGGKKTEVINETKNLILESANFQPTLIRKTAQKLGLQTDASKRFENEISPVIAETAINELSVLIAKSSPNAKFGELVDKYPEPTKPRVIKIYPDFVAQKLGVKISEKEINNILARLGIVDGIIPPERLDLREAEDLVEEIGRLYGYDKLPVEKLPATKATVVINKNFYWENKIRQILAELGFSEIMTSAFRTKGETEIEKPLALDKAFLRTKLANQLFASLKFNTLNAPLLDLKEIKIFEIGKVFLESGEETHLAFNKIAKAKPVLEKALEIKISAAAADDILEINLGPLIEKLPEPKVWNIAEPKGLAFRFQPISPYPFIVRDIAVFVPTTVTAEKLWTVIEKGIAKEKNLLANHYLFDEYQKAEKKSFAFRLIFQAPTRTLTDAEVNKIMEKVTTAISQNNWQVR
ncbi:MAG: Phenylalanine-tRNA ligase beta subunit [Parcubacteria group bacterium Gr01-1014_73]|nr:MAG: Phenylalanine-tRNA ligase beta subunit [Parcubacteria group bacterium Gr01-1014_73]